MASNTSKKVTTGTDANSNLNGQMTLFRDCMQL